VDEKILGISLTLLAVSSTAWLAIRAYYTQKEYELILNRYLEGSLDLLASDLQMIVTIFNHNWARCLAIIKSYRDLGDDFDLNELSKGFLELTSSNPNIIAHHRLNSLTGTMNYWNYYQHATSYYTGANSVITKEIPEVIRVKVSGELINNSHHEIIESAFQTAREQNEKSHVYVQLISEFQDLATALETERFTFKNLINFKKNKNVKISLKRVSETLKLLEKEDDL
jgi:hypothetical protein